MPDDDERSHLYTRLELSANQLKRLGDALAAERRLSPAEQELYASFSTDAMNRTTHCTAAVRGLFQSFHLQDVLPRVAAAKVTGRPKTKRTLVEKLQRDPKTKLPTVHDVAGVRLIGAFGLFEQQQALEAMRLAFDRYIVVSRPAVVVDRLSSPSFGYRALHLVVWPEGRPVEIQLRTELQHAWAELMEVLGDRWGREPRYGVPVNYEDDQERDRRQSIVNQLVDLSADVAAVEEASFGAGLAHVHPPEEALETGGLDLAALQQAQRRALEEEPQTEAAKQHLLRSLTQFAIDAGLG